ncbi:MAG: 2-hydroxyhepta-2,4-diene-1,7-dioate isomerase [Flavobacterium sp. BFFFF2]|nr:MAG: 2-hydroxyhepta-2,4-diene-1,7-dioate isomerase [Flavobacterium sp. BFFFF2]
MKIICVGRNYVDHVDELKNERPTEPLLFLKPDSALLPKNNHFYIPEWSQNLQHEIELVVKINRVGKYIEKQFAHKYYDEITVGIDFTARDVQDKLKAAGHPWERAKAFDHSAVVGKFISKNAIESVENCNFELHNSQRMVQKGNTASMIWSVDELIAEASKYFTLKIGDLLFTGTPSGVAAVKNGDILEGFLEQQRMFKVTIR